MNNCAERLNQTFMRKINIMLKNADLSKKWWSKIIIIVNLYRNISSVVDLKDKINRFIIFFKIFTNHMYNYNHIYWINQLNETLNIKSSTDWKKLIDHIKLMILIDYEKKHIYRMIDWSNKIKQMFNVYWLNHKKSLKQQKNQINKFIRIDNICSVQQTSSIVFFISTNIIVIDKFLDAFDIQLNEAEVLVSRQIALIRSRNDFLLIVFNILIINQSRQRRIASSSN